MADKNDKRPESVPGKFYVDSQCIDCDLCRETAPANFTRAAVRQHTEASLRRLGVDTLDLTQFHCVPPDVLMRGELFACGRGNRCSQEPSGSNLPM